MMTHQLQLTHEPDHAVTIGDGEQVILTYQYGAGLGYPYCHPVNLPDGPSVTLHKPFDHPWHLGLYFAWKYINGLNVWEGRDSGEPWGATRHLQLEPIEDQGAGAGVWHAVAWGGGEGNALLRDERCVLVRPTKSSRYHCIDWALTFTPLVDAVELDRKVEWGGYAGLGVRLPRSFVRPDVLNAEGQTDTAQTHLARSAWTDYSGWIDGQDRPAWGGVTIIDHPSNPRFPTPWLTYDVREFQYLNAAFLRDEPLVVRQGETLRLAYRVLVHWEQGDRHLIETEARAFAATNPHQEIGRLLAGRE